MKRLLQSILLALLGFPAAAPTRQLERWPVGLTDMPVVLPPYYSSAAEHKLAGEVTFKLTFEKGKVIVIDLVAKHLRSQAKSAVHNAIEDTLILKTRRVLRGWRILDGSFFTTSVRITYIPDDALEENETTYNVKYDHRGAISEIRITGSPKRTILNAPQ